MDNLDELFSDRFTITGEVNGLVTHFLCGCYGVRVDDPGPWAFPVGDGTYPPAMWYAASVHSLDGSLNGGYRHSGYDLNLDVAPRGDIERTLGLKMTACCDGQVEAVLPDWYGTPALVLRGQHAGQPIWIRYGHIVPVVREGDQVKAGDVLGTFANWRTGDHCHFDMALDPIKGEWLHSGVYWIDPALVLAGHLDEATVKAMLAKGG
ncbi:MAG: M23 family metallopeptidase [Anaerolineae bacterium]|nr:M23 family metallopeptidase [Anaerolineae bacterium]